MKCPKCGNDIPTIEWEERYNQMVVRGIIPNMVLLCKDCRDKVVELVKFQLTEPKGSIQ